MISHPQQYNINEKGEHQNGAEDPPKPQPNQQHFQYGPQSPRQPNYQNPISYARNPYNTAPAPRISISKPSEPIPGQKNNIDKNSSNSSSNGVRKEQGIGGAAGLFSMNQDYSQQPLFSRIKPEYCIQSYSDSKKGIFSQAGSANSLQNLKSVEQKNSENSSISPPFDPRQAQGDSPGLIAKKSFQRLGMLEEEEGALKKVNSGSGKSSQSQNLRPKQNNLRAKLQQTYSNSPAQRPEGKKLLQAKKFSPDERPEAPLNPIPHYGNQPPGLPAQQYYNNPGGGMAAPPRRNPNPQPPAPVFNSHFRHINQTVYSGPEVVPNVNQRDPSLIGGPGHGGFSENQNKAQSFQEISMNFGPQSRYYGPPTSNPTLNYYNQQSQYQPSNRAGDSVGPTHSKKSSKKCNCGQNAKKLCVRLLTDLFKNTPETKSSPSNNNSPGKNQKRGGGKSKDFSKTDNSKATDDHSDKDEHLIGKFITYFKHYGQNFESSHQEQLEKITLLAEAQLVKTKKNPNKPIELTDQEKKLIKDKKFEKMNSKTLIERCTNDKEFSSQVQNYLSIAPASVIEAMLLKVEFSALDMCFGKYSNYLIQTLLETSMEFEARFAVICTKNFDSMISDQYASRVLQKLILLKNEALIKHAAELLKKDYTYFIKDLSSIIFTTKLITESKAPDRFKFFVEILEKNPSAVVNKKGLMRVLVAIFTALDSESLNKIFEVLKPFLWSIVNHKFGCYILQKVMEREIQPAKDFFIEFCIKNFEDMLCKRFTKYVLFKSLELVSGAESGNIDAELNELTSISMTSRMKEISKELLKKLLKNRKLLFGTVVGSLDASLIFLMALLKVKSPQLIKLGPKIAQILMTDCANFSSKPQCKMNIMIKLNSVFFFSTNFDFFPSILSLFSIFSI